MLRIVQAKTTGMRMDAAPRAEEPSADGWRKNNEDAPCGGSMQFVLCLCGRWEGRLRSMMGGRARRGRNKRDVQQEYKYKGAEDATGRHSA